MDKKNGAYPLLEPVSTADDKLQILLSNLTVARNNTSERVNARDKFLRNRNLEVENFRAHELKVAAHQLELQKHEVEKVQLETTSELEKSKHEQNVKEYEDQREQNNKIYLRDTKHRLKIECMCITLIIVFSALPIYCIFYPIKGVSLEYVVAPCTILIGALMFGLSRMSTAELSLYKKTKI